MSQEELIQAILEEYDFHVTKIPERPDTKTPDFYVEKAGDEYTIELKTKLMNQDLINNMIQAFDQGEMYTDVISLDHNRYRDIIHKTKKQLASEPIYENSMNIPWFHCEGQDASTTMELFENALYGKVYITDWKDGTDKSYVCYYFHSNAMFAQYKDVLDGAIVSKDGELRVLLNVYSPNYETLKNSSLCSTFKDGVIDPLESEILKECLLVDDDMDRANIIDELHKKYGMKALQTIPMKSYTITVSTSH